MAVLESVQWQSSASPQRAGVRSVAVPLAVFLFGVALSAGWAWELALRLDGSGLSLPRVMGSHLRGVFRQALAG